jgi:hypothetical protein
MATPGQPFDRNLINVRERPLSSDVDYDVTYLDRSLRYTLSRLNGTRIDPAHEVLTPGSGFVGDGFECVPTSPTSLIVNVQAGLGFLYNPSDLPTAIGGIVGVDDIEPYKPMVLSAPVQMNLAPAPAPGSERWDLIEAAPGRLYTGGVQTRDVFNVGLLQFQPSSVQKLLTWDLVSQTGSVTSPASSVAPLSRKIGVPAPTGTATQPNITAGYLPVAYVYVAGGATTIDYDAIVDQRTFLAPFGQIQVEVTFSMRTAAGGGATLPSAVNVAVPPGIRVAAVGNDLYDSGAFRAVDVYLLMGNSPLSVHPRALTWPVPGFYDIANGTAEVQVVANNGFISTAEQSALVGAQSAYAVKARATSGGINGQARVKLSVAPFLRNAAGVLSQIGLATPSTVTVGATLQLE